MNEKTDQSMNPNSLPRKFEFDGNVFVEDVDFDRNTSTADVIVHLKTLMPAIGNAEQKAGEVDGYWVTTFTKTSTVKG